MFRGRYHSYAPVAGTEEVEQCRPCDHRMSDRRIEAIISACSNDLPFRIIDGQRQLISMLDQYYLNSNRRWQLSDLVIAMRDPSFLNVHGNPPIIATFTGKELEIVDVNLESLDLVDVSANYQTYYIPFFDQHAMDGFTIQLRQVWNCIDILNKDWHVTDEQDRYIESFYTLEAARRFVQHFMRDRAATIYKDQQQYEQH